MKKAALAALLLVVLVPLQAKALDTEELLGLVAMPLAVAAASEVTGVPVSELSHFVATLNRAQVPPTQIVQVVRYAPAALVIGEQQPTFIEYVDYEVDRGVTGPQLVTVIEERYRTYGLEPQFLTFDEPATTYVVRDDYIPEVVVARVAADTNDLLALAALPLAVAAAAEITGVPMSDLSSLVATLNAARVPPVQVVEVLRYAPAILVDEVERPRFVQFVNTQVTDGVRGPQLVEVIDDRLRTYDTRTHPHGGPPGQLKKQLGLQTGAEVVHGSRRSPRVVAERDTARPARPAKVRAERVVKQRAEQPRVERRKVERAPKADRQPKIERQRVDKPKAGRGQGNGNEKGDAKGNGKGKGKG